MDSLSSSSDLVKVYLTHVIKCKSRFDTVNGLYSLVEDTVKSLGHVLMKKRGGKQYCVIIGGRFFWLVPYFLMSDDTAVTF